MKSLEARRTGSPVVVQEATRMEQKPKQRVREAEVWQALL